MKRKENIGDYKTAGQIKKALFTLGHQVHKPHTYNDNKAQYKHANPAFSLILTHNPDKEAG